MDKVEDDLICRRDAVDAVQKLRDAEVRQYGKVPCKGYWELTAAMNAVRCVPSAQPNLQPTCNLASNDCISRHAILKAINNMVKECESVYVTSALRNLEAIVADLPLSQPDLSGYSDKLWKAAYERGKAEAQQRWIPCSERLPEEGQEILATTTDNAWGDVVIIRTYYKEMHKSVIAWMPLPEPYAERRTDDESI